MDGKRVDWDDYFLSICAIVASRSTCNRGPGGGGVGCVLVKDRNILATGYAGSLPGAPHCDDVGHSIRKVTYEDGETREHCCRTVHAEANAVAQAARRGLALDGATAYINMAPCDACAKLLVSAGIERVVSSAPYHAYGASMDVFKGCDILLEYSSGREEEEE
jgi:dCMP deaminase